VTIRCLVPKLPLGNALALDALHPEGNRRYCAEGFGNDLLTNACVEAGDI